MEYKMLSDSSEHTDHRSTFIIFSLPDKVMNRNKKITDEFYIDLSGKYISTIIYPIIKYIPMY